MIAPAHLLGIQKIDDPFFASRSHDFTPVQGKHGGRKAAHIEIFPGQVIVIGGRKIIHQLHVFGRKLRDRVRQVPLARIVGAVTGSGEHHAVVTDGNACASPDAGGAPRRLEEVDLVIRGREVHGVDAGFRAAAALRGVGVQNAIRQIQAPVLGIRRHELYRRHAVLAINHVQHMQFPVAGDRVDPRGEPLLADQRGRVQSIRTQPERLLSRLHVHGERFFPKQFTRSSVHCEKMIGRAAHDGNFFHALVGDHPLDHNRGREPVQLAGLIFQVGLPQQGHRLRVVAIDISFLRAPAGALRIVAKREPVGGLQLGHSQRQTQSEKKFCGLHINDLQL